MLPKTLVTGATGKTGSAVAAQLLEKGWPVRALVRTMDARAQRLQKLGAEVVTGDLFDPEQVLQALRGTQRAYYCSFIHPHMLQSASAFAIAAREAKLEALVSLGMWLASPSHPSLHTRHDWLMEQLFLGLSGIDYVRVNPGWFADNNLRVIAMAIHLGVFPWLGGEGKNAPPSNEDIARVAVAALMDPAKHAGKAYRPTGPELLSGDDMVRILSQVLQRKVRRVDLPWWMFERAARMQQVSAFQMLSLRDYVQDYRDGAFAVSAPTDHVLRVTGRPPESFATIAARYAALPENQNKLGTWLEFLRNPISPGYKLDRLDRELAAPVPPNRQFAMQNESWKYGHGVEFLRQAGEKSQELYQVRRR